MPEEHSLKKASSTPSLEEPLDDEADLVELSEDDLDAEPIRSDIVEVDDLDAEGLVIEGMDFQKGESNAPLPPPPPHAVSVVSVRPPPPPATLDRSDVNKINDSIVVDENMRSIHVTPRTVIDTLIEDVRTNHPANMALWLQEEVQQSDSDEHPNRRALLHYELGHLYEWFLDQREEALKTYAQAFSLDPALLANRWALRRLLLAQKRWPNLIKLLEADVGLATRSEQRLASSMLKGWVFQYGIADLSAATESFWEAYRTDTTALGPLLALERLFIAEKNAGELAKLYRLMAERTTDPERRLVAYWNLAEVQHRVLSDHPMGVLETLRQALLLGVREYDTLMRMNYIAIETAMHKDRIGILTQLSSNVAAQGESALVEAAAYMRQASRLAAWHLDHPKESQALLKRALALCPEHPLLQYDYVTSLLSQNDWQALCDYYQERFERLSSDEEKNEATLDIAHAAKRVGNDAVAEERYRQSLSMKAGQLPAVFELERAYIARHDYGALLELYEREGAAAGNTAWGGEAWLRAAAVAFFNLNQTDTAIAHCRRAIEMSSEQGAAHELLLHMLWESDAVEPLIRELSQRVDHDVVSERRRLLGERLFAIYGKDPQHDAALIPLLNTLSALSPDDDAFLIRQLPALSRLGSFREMEDALRRLSERTTRPETKRELLLWRADLLESKLNNETEAVALYRQVFDDDAQCARALCALERLLRKQKRYADLVVVLERRVEHAVGDDRITTLFKIAELWRVDLLDDRKAEMAYRQILLIDPHHREALFELQNVAESRGDLDRVAELIETELPLISDTREASARMIELAEVYTYGLRRPERAEELLAQIQTSDSALSEEALYALSSIHLLRRDYEAASETINALAATVSPPLKTLFEEMRATVLEAIDPADTQTVALWQSISEREKTHLRSKRALWRNAARRRDASALEQLMRQFAESSSDAALVTVFKLRALTLGLGRGNQEATRFSDEAWILSHTEAMLATIAHTTISSQQLNRLLEKLSEGLNATGQRDVILLRARELELSREYSGALKLLHPILSVEKNNLFALTMAQRCCRALGAHPEEATLWVLIANRWQDPESKGYAYFEAACCYELAGNHQNAAALYRHALNQTPNREEVLSGLENLYRTHNDIDGLLEVLGYRLGRATTEVEKNSLRLRRAELFLDQKQDRELGVLELLRIVKTDPRHLAALTLLARELEKASDTDGAIRIHEQLLQHTEGTGHDALYKESTLKIATLLQKAHRSVEGVERCQRYLELFPDDDAVLERVSEIYLENHDYSRAVESLTKLGTLRTDIAWKAENLRKIGDLYRFHLKDPRRAKQSLLKAREFAPMNVEILGALRKLCVEEKWDAEFAQILDRAKDDLRDALTTNPVDVGLYRALMQLADWNQDQQLLIAALAALTVLNAADAHELELYQRRANQFHFDPQRASQLDQWQQQLWAPGTSSACGELWMAIAECVPELFPGRVPRDPHALKLQKTDRVDRKAAGPVSLIVDRYATLFGIGEMELYLASHEADRVTGVVGESITLVIGHAVATEMRALHRFRLGRTLSLLHRRCVALDALDLKEITLLIAAALHLIEPKALDSFVVKNGLDIAMIGHEAQRLNRVLSRRAKKGLSLAMTRFLQEGAEVASWVEGTIETANRTGLLCCGDITVAIHELLGSDLANEKTPHQRVATIKKHSQVTKLLLFSINPAYLELRSKMRI